MNKFSKFLLLCFLSLSANIYALSQDVIIWYIFVDCDEIHFITKEVHNSKPSIKCESVPITPEKYSLLISLSSAEFCYKNDSSGNVYSLIGKDLKNIIEQILSLGIKAPDFFIKR